MPGDEHGNAAHTTKAKDQFGREGHETLHPMADGSDGNGPTHRLEGHDTAESGEDKGDESGIPSAGEVKDSVTQALVSVSGLYRGGLHHIEKRCAESNNGSRLSGRRGQIHQTG
jgi:hypothetical protein